MKQTLTWIAVVLMLTGAVLIVPDVGPAGLWIADHDRNRPRGRRRPPAPTGATSSLSQPGDC
jgi:hypothetical protein